MFGTTFFLSPSITTPFPDGLVDEVVEKPDAAEPAQRPITTTGRAC